MGNRALVHKEIVAILDRYRKHGEIGLSQDGLADQKQKLTMFVSIVPYSVLQGVVGDNVLGVFEDLHNPEKNLNEKDILAEVQDLINLLASTRLLIGQEGTTQLDRASAAVQSLQSLSKW